MLKNVNITEKKCKKNARKSEEVVNIVYGRLTVVCCYSQRNTKQKKDAKI